MVELTSKKIENQIKNLEKEVAMAPKRKMVELKERFFSVNNKEDIEEIFILYGLDDLTDQIDSFMITEAKIFGLSNNVVLKMENGKDLIEKRDKMSNVLKQLEKIAKRKNALLSFYRDVEKFINSHFSYNEKKYNTLIEHLNDMAFIPFDERRKYEEQLKELNDQKVKDGYSLIKQLDEAFGSKKISNCERTMVDIFEKKLSLMKEDNNNQKSNNVLLYIDRYFNPSGDFFLGEGYEILASVPTVGGADNINDIITKSTSNGLNVDAFAYIVISLLDIIKNFYGQEHIKECYAALDTLHEVFMPFFEIRKEMTRIRGIIDTLSKTEQDNFYDNINRIRMLYNDLENEFIDVDINSCWRVEELIKNINDEIDNIRRISIEKENASSSESRVERKGLVLFDSNGKNEVYVLKDLLGPDCFIERVAVEKTPNYAEEFSDLINNFVIKASEFRADDISVEANREKLCTEISNKDRNGKVNRKDSTGIYRLRPNFNSNVRVAERKIVVPKDKKIHKQIIDLIKKHFTYYVYDLNTDLIIFDVCGAAVKVYDETLYDEITTKRKRDLSIIRLIAKDGKYINDNGKVDFEVKDEFTSGELALFDEYLKNTVVAMRKLKDDNKNYKFEYLIDNLYNNTLYS